MNTVYLSICSCNLQFLLLVSYSLPGTSLYHLRQVQSQVLFDVKVNDFVSSISLSNSSLLVYRNVIQKFTYFCILILYPTTLPNSLMHSSILVVSLGLSMYGIMSSANSDRFTSYFLTCIPFISFSCLIAMVRTPNTVLNKSSESGHPCLVPDLRGNAFSFSLLSIMLSVGLSYMAFIMLKYVPSVPNFLKSFYYK